VECLDAEVPASPQEVVPGFTPQAQVFDQVQVFQVLVFDRAPVFDQVLDFVRPPVFARQDFQVFVQALADLDQAASFAASRHLAAAFLPRDAGLAHGDLVAVDLVDGDLVDEDSVGADLADGVLVDEDSVGADLAGTSSSTARLGSVASMTGYLNSDFSTDALAAAFLFSSIAVCFLERHTILTIPFFPMTTTHLRRKSNRS
jgi:hypothetical protein